MYMYRRLDIFITFFYKIGTFKGGGGGGVVTVKLLITISVIFIENTEISLKIGQCT